MNDPDRLPGPARNADTVRGPRSPWVGPSRWRWLGFRRWHRWAIGPLAVGFYVYRPGEGLRPFVTHSWRRRNAQGEWRHHQTLRRWSRAKRRAAQNDGCECGGTGTIETIYQPPLGGPPERTQEPCPLHNDGPEGAGTMKP